MSETKTERTPAEAAANMLTTQTPAEARSVAVHYAHDYANGHRGRRYWLNVAKAIDSIVKQRDDDKAAQYGRRIQELWPATAHEDPARLFRKLRRLECKLSRMNEQACNGVTSAAFDRAYEMACERVKIILWGANDPYWPEGTPRLRFNSDPRGYALKVDDGWMREHRAARLQMDWGGYGLIAPKL